MMLSKIRQLEAFAKIGNIASLNVCLHAPITTPARQQVEQFIHHRFASHYQANVQHFMPVLLAMQNTEGEIQGAVGLRQANEPFFLERYLDKAIEQLIVNSCDLSMSRAQILKIGNFAAIGAASISFLIIVLTELLAALNYRWVAFTGTPMLINSLAV